MLPQTRDAPGEPKNLKKPRIRLDSRKSSSFLRGLSAGVVPNNTHAANDHNDDTRDDYRHNDTDIDTGPTRRRYRWRSRQWSCRQRRRWQGHRWQGRRRRRCQSALCQNRTRILVDRLLFRPCVRYNCPSSFLGSLFFDPGSRALSLIRNKSW